MLGTSRVMPASRAQLLAVRRASRPPRPSEMRTDATTPEIVPSADVTVLPIRPSACVSASDVTSAIELRIRLDRLLDVRERGELRHELRRIHGLGRILILHLRRSEASGTSCSRASTRSMARARGLVVLCWCSSRRLDALTVITLPPEALTGRSAGTAEDGVLEREEPAHRLERIEDVVPARPARAPPTPASTSWLAKASMSQVHEISNTCRAAASPPDPSASSAARSRAASAASSSARAAGSDARAGRSQSFMSSSDTFRSALSTAPLMKILSPARSERWVLLLIGAPLKLSCDTSIRRLEVLRTALPDFLGLTHHPEPHRDEIGPELLRQPVLGLGEILDEDPPQPAHEMQRLDRLDRARPLLLRNRQELDRALERRALVLTRLPLGTSSRTSS